MGHRSTRGQVVVVAVTDAAGGTAERRREQRGWYFYDWANSVFSTSVLTVFLGPYLTEIAKSAADADG
ncbi:MAG: MFS transporter, partial [Streptomyces sp.]